jgi:alanine dehydrogenase
MRRGSVVADIAVDQGGCIETTRPTTYDAPTYVEEGVTHFCVTNMPGAVPRSATQALVSAMLPYLLRLLEDDWRADSRLAGAVNVDRGEVVHPALL